MSNGKLTGADMNFNRLMIMPKAEKSRGMDLWGRVRSWGHPPLDRPSKIPLKISAHDVVNALKKAKVRQ